MTRSYGTTGSNKDCKRRGALGPVLVSLAVCAFLLLSAAPAAAAAPHIDQALPNIGPVGTPVAIVGTDFGTFGATSTITFNGVPATPVAWTDTTIATRVPDGATTGPLVVTALGVPSNAVPFTVTELPVRQTWYLAEGSTAHGFNTFLLMENPYDTGASASITYNTQQYGTIPRPQPISVPAHSRVTLNLNSDIPGVDVSTLVQATAPIVCERSIYWNGREEGTDSIGVTDTSTTWYLAEGCTSGGFETWILVQNPQIQTATINITYMTPAGVIIRAPFTVSPGQRYTIQVSGDVGATDVSTMVEADRPVVCERSVYWNNMRGGHNSIGVAAPAPNWYLAEGCTSQGYSTWLLVQNPNEDKTANVNVTYLTPSGPIVQPSFKMGPQTRVSIPVNSKVNQNDTSIVVKSDADVIAERSMYWNNGTGVAGHGTVGTMTTAQNVYLAEGCTSQGYQTFVCIMNPGTEGVAANITYMTPRGAIDGKSRWVPAGSRVTVNVNDELPNSDVSIKVSAASGIMAERAMYWNGRGGGHVSIGRLE